jgi:hypothetical protein
MNLKNPKTLDNTNGMFNFSIDNLKKSLVKNENENDMVNLKSPSLNSDEVKIPIQKKYKIKERHASTANNVERNNNKKGISKRNLYHKNIPVEKEPPINIRTKKISKLKMKDDTKTKNELSYYAKKNIKINELKNRSIRMENFRNIKNDN